MTHDRLHAERIASDRSKRSFRAALDEVPGGVFVTVAAWGDHMLVWSAATVVSDGDDRRVKKPRCRRRHRRSPRNSSLRCSSYLMDVVEMLPLYEDPCFTFRFADARLIPRFHLEGVEGGRRVSIFKIDPDTGKRLGLLATATVGEGGWVDLSEPIIVRTGEAFIAVADQAVQPS